MQDDANRVEIKLPAAGISLYGTIVGRQAQHLAVQLLTLPRSPAALKKGVQVTVASCEAAGTVIAGAQVASWRGVELTLIISRLPSRVQRRMTHRVAVNMPVQYRAIRGDAHMGAWLNATAVDVSAGGMGLVIDGRAEVPKRMEVMFELPTSSAGTKGISRMYADDGSVILTSGEEERAIRAIARTLHCRSDTAGVMRVGVAFSVISSADRQRVERFTGWDEEAAA